MIWKKSAVRSLELSLIAACAGIVQVSSSPARSGAGQPVVITVRVDQPGAQINPAMWGVFFEDINFGADGGLYAKMVKNRSFEFPEPLLGWSRIISNVARGEVTVLANDPFRETNLHYVRINSKAAAPLGITNEGFRGMGVRAGDAYDFSAQIRGTDGAPKVTVGIVGSDGFTLAEARLSGISPSWSKITATLHPKETDSQARLTIFVEGTGTVDFDMVSLFPQKTWKNRPGGLRADMVQMLADLKPGFLRFPGGCIVEGPVLAQRYQWKNTIGPVEDRRLQLNRWNNEFTHRPTPDYYQSFGLGFFEFFQLSEDIGAEPLPIVNCGMACQFNSGELCPMDALEPYIQDALDLIEFANGPATSTWGAKRAAMGHTAPFHMKMMGIGNEQWGPQYLERLALFTKAIKAKHPEIVLVSGAGPSPEDERYHFLWPKLREGKADIVDEHCYASPIWFLSNADRYDRFDRDGPKVFFGEYAAQSAPIGSPKNRNNLECALAEAAYMTGLERNADVVRMASYAPLFARVDAWQWKPDLIWTDNFHALATPSYYVQQLFSRNRGDVVLPVSNNAPVREILPAGRIGVGTSRSAAEFKDVRVTRGEKVLFVADFSKGAGAWSGEDRWRVAEGAYRQGDAGASLSSYAGESAWTDYTLTLKARKTGGTDGFIITVCDDGAGSYSRWILGGWGNRQHGIVTHYAQQDQFLASGPGIIETNRWYDLKIVMQGARMECYLDGKLTQSADILRRRMPSLYTSAVRETGTGETILKVVNPGDQPVTATIQLRGVTSIHETALATVLTGNRANENTFEKPNSVVPTTAIVTSIRPEFSHAFKPRSVTVLRLGKPKASQ